MQSSTCTIMVMVHIMATFNAANPLGTSSNDSPYNIPRMPSHSPKYLTEQTYKKIAHASFINITEDIKDQLANFRVQEDLESIKKNQARLEKNGLDIAASLSSLTTYLLSPLRTDIVITQPMPSASNGCVGGFQISGQCLVFSLDKLSWQDAKKSCSARNAKLVSLRDPRAFHEYAVGNYDEIITEEDERFWLGGSDSTNEASWIWINGKPFGDNFPWPQHQPDDSSNNEHCLQWGYFQNFNDARCTDKHRYVCQQNEDIISFDEHIPKYNIKYENAADVMRTRRVYEDNVKKIQEHNKLHDAGKTSYRKGSNAYSHLSYSEVLNKLTGFETLASLPRVRSEIFYDPINPGTEPFNINYVEKDAVNRIRDQGECGSCWAFSTTSVIESQIKLKFGVLPQLSEQYLVDCDKGFLDFGCYGGMPSRAIDFVRTHGIAFAVGYPYKAHNDICNEAAPKITYNVTSKQSIRPGNDNDLLNALVNHGPISVGIYASDNFRHYKSGVFVDDDCYPGVRPNHGVVLVGYGTENGQDYWLVRNSWGTTWGEGGYIKMSRSQHNFCEISSYAVFLIIDQNNNDNDIVNKPHNKMIPTQ